MCPFCNEDQSALSLHIKRKHSHEKEVENALKLPKKERDNAFEQMKREGIRKFNIKETSKDAPSYQSQRKPLNGNLIFCSACKITIQSSSMARHKQLCKPNAFKIPLKLLTYDSLPYLSDNFKKHILSTMRNDDTGLKCKGDPAILLYGSKEFEKSLKNPDKIFSVRTSVRRNMREVAKVYLIFLNLNPTKYFDNFKDLFLPENFHLLRKAITSYGLKDDKQGIKSGSKSHLQYLIVNAVKVFNADSHLNNRKEETELLERFLNTFRTYENVIFGDARFQVEMSKKKRLNLPEELPLESDMETLQKFTVNVVKNVDQNASFIEIRDAACTRITLYNGRR